jgi:hypothetical protein
MSHHEFTNLMSSINALSQEQMRQLYRELETKIAAADRTPHLTREETADQALQQRLLKAGIISEIKPPITDMTPYQNRRAVPIQGEPISETAIRERR